MSKSKSVNTNKILSIALTVFMLIGLLPQLTISAKAAAYTFDLFYGNISITSNTVTYYDSSSTEQTQSFSAGDELVITQTNNSSTISGSITVNGGTESAPLNITLSGVNIDSSACAFKLSDTSNVILTVSEGTENTLISSGYNGGVQLPAGASLIIEGSGSLNVTGGTNAAAIGGYGGNSGNGGAGGTLTINGGTLTVNGNIGGGSGGRGKSNSGSYMGFGLDGGNGGNGGNGGTITINFGIVTVVGNIGGGKGGNGGNGGAGVVECGDGGNGGNGGNGSELTITGGTVNVSGRIGGNSGGSGGSGGFEYGAPGSSDGSNGSSGGKGSCVITGGSLSVGTLSPAPTNGSDTVYLTTVTLDGITSQYSVSSLTADASYTYDTTDMMTDTNGRLYVWLPENTEITGAQTVAGEYEGSITTTTDTATSSGTLTKVLETDPPTVSTVTPNGEYTSLSGEIVITFSEVVDTATAGTVSLDGGVTPLFGGTWSNYNQTYTVSYSGLTNGTTYTVSISGFADTSGNAMADNTDYSFKTIPSCGNRAYLIQSDGDSAYSASYTDNGILNLTTNNDRSGFTYFGVNIAANTGHSGNEVCLFVHIRNGVQIGIMASKDDFDNGGSPCAGFNVKPGDVIEVYIVDELSNSTGSNPDVL